MALYFRSFLHIRGQMAFGSDRELSLSNYLPLPPSVSSRSELEEGGHVWKQTPVSSSSGCGSSCPQGKGRWEGMWNSVNWTLGYPILLYLLFFLSLCDKRWLVPPDYAPFSSLLLNQRWKRKIITSLALILAVCPKEFQKDTLSLHPRATMASGLLPTKLRGFFQNFIDSPSFSLFL